MNTATKLAKDLNIGDKVVLTTGGVITVQAITWSAVNFMWDIYYTSATGGRYLRVNPTDPITVAA